ncbi:unnamed protein product [Cochlearia groenlandica]
MIEGNLNEAIRIIRMTTRLILLQCVVKSIMKTEVEAAEKEFEQFRMKIAEDHQMFYLKSCSRFIVRFLRFHQISLPVEFKSADGGDGSLTSDPANGGVYLAEMATAQDKAVDFKSREYHMVLGATNVPLFKKAAVDDVTSFKLRSS